MAIDFSKIQTSETSDTVINPRDIFNMLTDKSDKYDYLRDVQTEVLNKWFTNRENKDTILKMNTGSGKTLVGLLILKSCLNENKGPAVYVVPDSYLITQVENEAMELGIEMTNDARSVRFIRRKAILIINIHKLVNGQSIFGVDSEGIKQEICSLIIDDAHACILKCEEQFTLNIPKKSKAYDSLFTLFHDDLKSQSETLLMDIEIDAPFVSMLLPFWSWQNNISSVVKIITAADDLDNEKLFKWPLIKKNINLCDCVFHSKGIELSLRCLPINILQSYENVERKIIMSATLPDDSELVTHLSIEESAIKNAITPNSASDIGDRMILVPQEINPNITEKEIKSFLKSISEEYNIVVIVPSFYRAYFWKDIAANTLHADNIEEGIENLKNNHVGLVVIVNKYDGIDLPKDACRILVIDNLPDARNEIDKIDNNLLGSKGISLVKKIQKIEQGMGRGVRSNEDYCVVFLMGASLINHLYTKDAINYFTPATKAQIELSEKLTEQIRGQDIDSFSEIIAYSLKRDKEWIKANKSALLHTKYEISNLNEMAIYLKKAYDLVELRDYKNATNVIQNGINTVSDKQLKGLLMYYLASFVNFYNNSKSQIILKSALKQNSRIPYPLEGIEYVRLSQIKYEQAVQFSNHFNIYKDNPNKLIIQLNSVLSDLIFLHDTSDKFEEAIKNLAFYLGFTAQRPEYEYRKGPDDLWSVGNLEYYVIECKNGATTDTIKKDYCNQMNGSIIWFKNKYDQTCVCTPILIHPSNRFNYASSPEANIRIMRDEELSKLKENVRKFIASVISNNYINKSDEIMKLLNNYKLNKSNFVNTYTTDFIVNEK